MMAHMRAKWPKKSINEKAVTFNQRTKEYGYGRKSVYTRCYCSTYIVHAYQSRLLPVLCMWSKRRNAAVGGFCALLPGKQAIPDSRSMDFNTIMLTHRICSIAPVARHNGRI